MIIIHIDNISKDGIDVKSDVVAVLNQHGLSVTEHEIGMLTFINAEMCDSVDSSQQPTVQPVDNIDSDIVSGQMPEVEVTLATPDEMEHIPEPDTVSADPEETVPSLIPRDDILLMSLTSTCPVKCMSGDVDISELHVHDLSIMAEYAAFSYCGMTFKYPLVDADTQNIRVVVRYNDFEHAILFKLVDAVDCMVVLSLNDCVLIFEESTDDKVSTQ